MAADQWFVMKKEKHTSISMWILLFNGWNEIQFISILFMNSRERFLPLILSKLVFRLTRPSILCMVIVFCVNVSIQYMVVRYVDIFRIQEYAGIWNDRYADRCSISWFFVHVIYICNNKPKSHSYANYTMTFDWQVHFSLFIRQY